MSSTIATNQGGADDHSLLENLLDAYEEARARGVILTADELCRNAPELRDQVALKIAALELVTAQMGLSEVLDGGAADSSSSETLNLHSNLTQLAFHAKGGLGAVYQAIDERLHRRVAVKFIHHNLVGNHESRHDFAIEAEVTGRLEHPGIVPLYGSGEAADGRPFYVMRFIDGVTMAGAIDAYHKRRKGDSAAADDNLAFKELLRQFISVCQTVAYAHNRGIVHHDIKPENVMLGKYGETIVVDWGLARPVKRDERFRLSGERTLHVQAAGDLSSTSSNSRRGTPAYMSPEQISGLPTTPASDIYSLGITLYKLLAGRTPFAGTRGHELLDHVITGRIAPPSKIRPSVPKPLEAICLKAVESQPANRYATALDLAKDVERFLADEKVSVYREPKSAKMFRWARRHRRPALFVAASLLAVAVVTALSSMWMARMAASERTARRQAEVMGRSSEEARRRNLAASAEFLAQRIGYEIDLRWRVLEAEANSPRIRELLKSVNADTTDVALREPLQAWLNERLLANGDAIPSDAWVVYASDGTQVARSPKGRSIGKNFAHRDYFHGFGKDFELDDPRLKTLKPLEFVEKEAASDEIVHMSAVFESSNTHSLVVSFAVPIWSGPAEEPGREIIGVMSMPRDIRTFIRLRHALLFQIEPNQYDNLPGHVIAHSALPVTDTRNLPPQVEDDVLNRAVRLRDFLHHNLEDLSDDDMFIDRFTDPVTGKVSPAAVRPIFIQSRPKMYRDTGWAVVITEEQGPPSEGSTPTE